ncbi:MAG: C39 family peptidase [Patescibacteria group bacterium]
MNKRFFYLLFSFVIVLAIGAFVNVKYSKNLSNVTPASTLTVKISSSPSASLPSSALPTPTSTQTPNSYLIENFPFQSQAPDANWDELHDEACEEASLILTHYYLNNKDVSVQEMEDQIQKMVNWEIENWGSHKDLTVKETGSLAKSFYGDQNFEIKNDITIEDVKKEIVNGYPVIIPTAGRLLGNPNFRSPGPVYHMVVAIGYDSDTIIVQDVGTRNGDHYRYNEKILYNAIHDWTGNPETIEDGQKTMLVFKN